MNNDRKKTILIVDDAKFIREYMCEVLNNDNRYQAIAAKDGKEGVAMFKEHNPDLVLLDINMPKMNGVEALQKMIALDSQARIIMISSEDDYDVIDDCKKFGAIKYITKPFNQDGMLQDIHVALYDEVIK
jgi:CheY-like chemotaxis protein